MSCFAPSVVPGFEEGNFSIPLVGGSFRVAQEYIAMAARPTPTPPIIPRVTGYAAAAPTTPIETNDVVAAADKLDALRALLPQLNNRLENIYLSAFMFPGMSPFFAH